MKRTITILLSLIPFMTLAQEAQTIGGCLVDGQECFEELDAAVLTESQSKQKNLCRKGMKIPGAVIMMTPENSGEEIGSLVKTRHPFLVKSISFTVEENRMEGCKACLRIYRTDDGSSPVNIVNMPIYQDIPKTSDRKVFSIVPEEDLVLAPGEYYIGFSLTGSGNESMDRIFFPLYVKSSYTRESPDAPLSEWGANIGIEVRGIRLSE